VSKAITSRFGPNEGWLRSGPAPATAPNTGFYFCPAFKFTYNSAGATDSSAFQMEITYVIETRGQRMMNVV